ncbi:MAG: bifunctional UDP-sugar hydrolase/5'-nucleotidase [Actinomycetaceae bacterium]|nr:bifunctional UDP-sugar hydrolase/5'-nucleotidase [Actinomycetaceae bacterium]
MRGTFIRSGAVAAASALLLSAVALPALAEENQTPDPASDSTEITIAAITDLHGHIEMMPNMACQLNELREENPNTFFVANGDSVGGSAFISSTAQDNPTMDILNAMDLRVSSVGNHEFDKGQADLKDRIMDRVAFRYITANVQDEAESFDGYTIIETPDKKANVAFIGATPKNLDSLVTPSGITGLTVTDPIEAVNQVAADLKDSGKADIVVALVHEDSKILEDLSDDVDAAVGGHSHRDKSGNTASGAPIIQPKHHGGNFAKIVLTIDADGNVTATASAVEVEAVKDKDVPECAGEEVNTIYEEAWDYSETEGAKEVGKISGVAQRGTNDGVAQNRGTESTAGNLIAQSFLEYSDLEGWEADFGVMNPGGIRDDFYPDDDGVITYANSGAVQPFGNNLATLKMTPSQIYSALEQQWKNPKDSHPVLTLGLSDNVQYEYNPEAKDGERITAVYLNGELLDREKTDKTYTAIGSIFLLGGGDGFEAFTKSDLEERGVQDVDAFNEVVKDQSKDTPWEVDYSQRGIGMGPKPVLEPGKVAPLKVYSLSMTAGEPKPEYATLTIVGGKKDGEKLAEVKLDNTPTPKKPETGQGVFEIDAPADLPAGDLKVRLTAGPTTYDFMLTVKAADDTSEKPGQDEKPIVKPSTGDTNGKTDAAGDKTNTGKGSLAKTGIDAWSLALFSLILMGGGVSVLAARRRVTE